MRGFRTRFKGSTSTDHVDNTAIQSERELLDRTAETIHEYRVAQEPSDAPAPHLSTALDLPRDVQPYPDLVAAGQEFPSFVQHRPQVLSLAPFVNSATSTIVLPLPPINNQLPSPLPPQPLPPTVDVGPWGGKGGSSWDDGVYDGVRELKIYSGLCIDSISVVYDKNGERISAGKHGGDGGSPNEIKLNYPEEYLVDVSGSYSPFYNGNLVVIRSLKFKTNKGTTFGPYGTKDGKLFSLPIRTGRIVGFIGKSGIALDNIGFHIIPS